MSLRRAQGSTGSRRRLGGDSSPTLIAGAEGEARPERPRRNQILPSLSDRGREVASTVAWVTRRGNPGTGFALGGAIVLLLTTAAEAMDPGYSVHTDAISYLGGQGVASAWFWDLQLLIVGVLWLWSSALLFRWKLRPYRSLAFYLTGVGLVLVATSPWNVSPVLHGIGALTALLAGIGSCVVGGGLTRGRMRALSYLAGAAALGAFLVGFVGGFGVLGPGGLERMQYYPIFLWSIAFGGYLLGRPSSAVMDPSLPGEPGNPGAQKWDTREAGSG